MVKLNHPVKIDNKIITPFLVQGDNVLCFNRRKETIFIPVDKFNIKEKKKKIVIPMQTTNPVVPKAIIAKVEKPEPPKEEIIVIKKDPINEKNSFKFNSLATIKLSGSAKTNLTVKIIEEVIIPPVVDNNRYVRPSLDDDYI